MFAKSLKVGQLFTVPMPARHTRRFGVTTYRADKVVVGDSLVSITYSILGDERSGQSVFVTPALATLYPVSAS